MEHNAISTFEKGQLLSALDLLATADKQSTWRAANKVNATGNAAIIHRLADSFKLYTVASEKFTRDELTKALETPVGFTNSYDATNAIVSRIKNARKDEQRKRDDLHRKELRIALEERMATIKADTSKQDKETTVTQAELIEALKRTTTISSAGVKFNKGYWSAENMARDLVKDIKTHRENYESGTVVSDAKGVWYRRQGTGWERFGSSRGVAYDRPVRPLTVQFNKDNGK